MKRLSDLPIGAKIKDINTKYNGHTIVWIIADKNHRGYPNNTVTLISERVLLDKKFDSSTIKYQDSELRRWINDNNGLLKNFSSNFKNDIVYTSISTASGNATDKMFLVSMTEVGLESGSEKEGYRFPLFTDNNSRMGKDFDNSNKAWWLRTFYKSTENLLRTVDTDGNANAQYYYNASGVRPLCNLKPEILIYDNKGSDGAYTISWNRIPIIETTTSANMGLQNKEFEFTYKVSDQDNPTLTVNEYLDGKSTKQFTATAGSTYTFSLSRLAYQKLLNGNHTIKIVANDNEGGVAEKVFNFRKNETKILFELEKPLEADAMVTKALINLVATIPEKALLKIEACNNGNDANPTWEDVTDKVTGNKKMFFSNKQKTASNWGFNIRVSVERNGAIGECYISSIGGNFE